MQAFFSHFDNRSGYITPEAYTAFLTACGNPDSQNTWKNAFNSANPALGGSRESQADAALKRAFDSFGVEHHLLTRPPSGPFANNPPNGMPVLTLNGFITITTFETLFDPNKGHSDLNRAMRALNLQILREKGELPRWTLPESAPQQIVQRVQEIQRNATGQAAAMYNMGVMGNAAAINAVGGNVRVGWGQGF
jgi:hypothetical protein